MLFAPLSFERYAYPLVFMIDPYFGAIALVGLIGALWRRWPAVAALTVMAGYVVLTALLHQRAIEFGEAYARLNHLEAARSYALPQPFSPFNWKVIVAHGDRYDHALVRLNSDSSGDGTSLIARTRQSYRRPDSLEWTRYSHYGETAQQTALARAAWNQPAFEPFRRFAQFPALDHVDGVCVWFVDLRFTLPEFAPSFRYGMCRTGEDWVRVRLRGDFLID
jgi:inner membrane protein